jgi:hypothetical protein
MFYARTGDYASLLVGIIWYNSINFIGLALPLKILETER